MAASSRFRAAIWHLSLAASLCGALCLVPDVAEAGGGFRLPRLVRRPAKRQPVRRSVERQAAMVESHQAMLGRYVPRVQERAEVRSLVERLPDLHKVVSEPTQIPASLRKAAEVHFHGEGKARQTLVQISSVHEWSGSGIREYLAIDQRGQPHAVVVYPQYGFPRVEVRPYRHGRLSREPPVDEVAEWAKRAEAVLDGKLGSARDKLIIVNVRGT